VITNEPSPVHDPSVDAPVTTPPAAQLQQQPTDIAGSPAGNVWGILGAIFTWLFSVGALLIVPLLFVVPYFIYLFTTSGPPSAEALATNKTFLLLSILGVIPAHLLTLGVVWIVITKWGKYPFWQTVGFKWPPMLKPWKALVFSVITAVILLAIGSAVTNFFGGEKTALDQLIESSFQARLATAFLAFATGPLIEELVYRGVLYPALARVIGISGAVAIVSILFAGVHVYQYQNNLAVIAVITLLSVVLTSVRAITGSVLPGFIIHLVFNGVQSIIIVLQPFTHNSDKVAPQPAPACDLIFHLLRHLV
jgi:membrane protease YdiL (CAAX protease family)